MEIPRLANIDPQSDWTRLTTLSLAAAGGRDGALAILPVYGIGDHGLGLPLDVEEAIGSEVLRRACRMLRAGGGEPWVLPPLRFGPAPYPCQHFGFDPDDATRWVLEIADGVERAGFKRMVFIATSPWHREWIDATALDLHAETGLEVCKLHLADIGLALHPGSPMAARAMIQAVGAGLCGVTPDRPLAGEQRDVDFRPGTHLRPEPVDASALPADFDCKQWLAATAQRCADLLGEVGGVTAGLQESPDDAVTWQPFGNRYLPSLTERALGKLSSLEKAVVILPLSATEQHGPHLPLGVDAHIGEGVLRVALARLPEDGRVWVAPPVSIGKSVEHRDFPGTLSISSQTLRALLTAQIGELHGMGFGTIAIWNTHGGNSAVLNYTLRELQSLPGIRVVRLEAGPKPGLSAQEAAYGFHAGLWETSVMLALAPELVDMGRAVCCYPARIDDPGELRIERSPITRAWLTKDVAPDGVMGDATAATAAQGVEWLNVSSTAIAGQILRLLER